MTGRADRVLLELQVGRCGGLDGSRTQPPLDAPMDRIDEQAYASLEAYTRRE